MAGLKQEFTRLRNMARDYFTRVATDEKTNERFVLPRSIVSKWPLARCLFLPSLGVNINLHRSFEPIDMWPFATGIIPWLKDTSNCVSQFAGKLKSG